MNGDGYSDVIVGARRLRQRPRPTRGGRSSTTARRPGLAATPRWTAESDQAGAQFGCSVATAGDVNGDGYADVIVGAPLLRQRPDRRGAGLRLPRLGGRARVDARLDRGGRPGRRRLRLLGGDGGGRERRRLLATSSSGADYYDNGETDEGRAFVYHGSACGPERHAPPGPPRATRRAPGSATRVATAGDVNGDGYCRRHRRGACSYDNGQTDEGRAFVYHGSAAGLSASAGWTAEGDQAGAGFGYSRRRRRGT